MLSLTLGADVGLVLKFSSLCKATSDSKGLLQAAKENSVKIPF